MKDNTMTALTSFSMLQQQIDEICGRVKVPENIAAMSSLSLSSALAKAAKQQNTIMDVVMGKSLAASLAQTNVMASNIGLEQIAGVTTQISSITNILASVTKNMKEVIAPTVMITDLQKLAIQTRKIAETGTVSAWSLGVLNCASLMVDRQVDWTANICSSVYGDKPIEEIEETEASQVNIISVLPHDLEEEKKKDGNITAADALELTDSFRVSEKGKGVIEKIVSINKACKRNGREALFKTTDTTLMAAATMGGTVCTTKEAFGNIIDCLYAFFYENLERIMKVVSDDAVRNEDVFQCIFRVKDFRTDYRHDYEHGREKDIKKKETSIGDSYRYYAGKPVLFTREDYVGTQIKLYNEFDVLASYLLTAVAK